MSLAVIKDLTKYHPANQQGELQFSKHGLIDTKSSIQISFKISGFNNAYYMNNFFRWRFSCEKFNYILHFSDVNFATTDDWSQDPTKPIHQGSYVFNPSPFDFDIPRLIDVLQGSILGQYYDISYTTVSHPSFDFILTLTAKEASSDYDLTLDCEYNSPGWVNGGSIWVDITTNYSAASDYPDYKLHLRILVEDEDALDTYKEIYTIYHNVGHIDNGRTVFTFREIPFVIRQHLSFPSIQNPYRLLIDKDVLKKFKVEYWESYTGANTPRRVLAIDTKYALLSGAQESAKQNLETPMVSINNVPERYYIAHGQPAWFSFLLSEELLSGVSEIFFKVSNNIGVTHEIGGGNYYLHHSKVYHLPIWLGADTTENDELLWVEGKIELHYPDADPYIVTRRYYFDKTYYAVEKWFYYLNSLGGIDTLRLCGDSEDSLVCTYSDYETIRDGEDIIQRGTSSRFSSSSIQKTKGLSGWIDRNLIDVFEDFVHSRFIYQVEREHIPVASDSGDTIPYYPGSNHLFLSIRSVAHRMTSTKMIVDSKELAIPKESSSMVSFAIDLVRAYSDIGHLHSERRLSLPKLQEDTIELTALYSYINKNGVVLSIEGYMALPDVYINGTKATPISTTSLPLTDSYGWKQVNYLASLQNPSAHILIRGNYIRDIRILTIDGVDNEIHISKASCMELRRFEINAIENNTVYGIPRLWMRNWRTLEYLRAHKLTQLDATKLLMAIKDHYNFNAPSASGWFSEVNLVGLTSGSGIVSSPSNNIPALKSTLNAKGIIVTI